MLTLIKKSRGLLGMNSRNLEYIRPKNSRGSIRLANNKLASKKKLLKAGIPVPEIYGVIRNRKDLEQFDWSKLPKSFVLKPNRGMGGDGIVIIYGKKGENCWITAAGKLVTLEDLKSHILNIFDGFYSMYGGEDVAFIEERIKISKSLKPYSYRGIPDIRVIVYNNVPVMAMLRLSTKSSDGKANLHMGGIGTGIDIATGVTTHAVMHDRVIEKTPDTRLKLSGIRVPYWKDILGIAIRCQKSSGLGYIGVDIAIDKDKGPVVLEINAHAGLSIQIANMAPLKYRLQKVRGLKIKNEAHAIRVAQDLFGGEVEQEIAEISGKQILGIVESVKVGYRGEEAKFMDLRAKVDTGAGYSSIDKTLARKLGYESIINEFDEATKDFVINNSSNHKDLELLIKDRLEFWGDDFSAVLTKSSHGVSYRLMIKMDLVLAGIKIHTAMSVIDRSNLQFPVIIGRKSLKSFLVDPSKSSGGIL
jgi:alpha-L-glutamate ligase-like protein